jgi:hypothetical protein
MTMMMMMMMRLAGSQAPLELQFLSADSLILLSRTKDAAKILYRLRGRLTRHIRVTAAA